MGDAVPHDHWDRFVGEPLRFSVVVTSDAVAADVIEADWRHPDVATITMSGGGITVADDSDGNIVVKGDAGAPTGLVAGSNRDAQLALDTGAGLVVVQTATLHVHARTPA